MVHESQIEVVENVIAKEVVDAAFQIHQHFGPGLFETVYEVVLAHELRQRGYQVERQTPIAVEYRGIRFDEGFRADIIINDRVVIELKSIEQLAPTHFKQLLTYLRLMQKRLGLLINFNEALIKNGIHRVANGMPQ